MSKNYLNIIITHGNLACALKAITEKLVVPVTDFLCFSNEELSIEEIEAQITAKYREMQPQKIVVFVDLVGGSCWLSANRLKQTISPLVVIGGVNVPMLVSYQINYHRLEDGQLIEKIIADGQKGIVAR